MGFGSYRTGLGRKVVTVLLSLMVFCALGGTSRASATWPYVEVTHAVEQTGAVNVEAATTDQFLHAFAAVLATKKSRDFAAYVGAAVKLRPDLADKIVATALKICKLNKSKKDVSCPDADEIVAAAILANPDAAESIVRAALLVMPGAKDAIVAAAIKAAPDQELFILRAAGEAETMAFLQPSPFGSINPLNYGGAEPVNSPEQPPTP